ncbi:NDR1/HIN1-like protein 3 [Rhodamnia argentea]|uniref:NDR1/HIN1-like protein 3 n=1 Tax=Rhodamnia argentea TaxID=178133 RepID=A0A8B8NG91_9MYRT|nr:NDR1/HIN1-like protein 3 [Rhodamnia argentea]
MAIAKRVPRDVEEDPWDAHTSMMTWASSILLAIIFLIVLGVSVIWLTVNPRQLKYAVEDAFVSNFNVTGGHLATADFNISLSAKNPNHRVSFSYDSMKVSVKSHGYTLASSDVPRFTQGTDTFKPFEVNLMSRDVVLPESTSSHLMDGGTSGEIKIDVIIEARVTFKARHWKHDHCMIRVFCAEAVARSSQETAFKQTKCSVEL